MHDWRGIMNEADLAKRRMVIDQAEGEALFEKLINRIEPDGMVYYKRAEAYEARDQFERAIADFRKALALFPMKRWKRQAKEGIYRVEKALSKK